MKASISGISKGRTVMAVMAVMAVIAVMAVMAVIARSDREATRTILKTPRQGLCGTLRML